VLYLVVICDGFVSGNANVIPASAYEIEKAIAAAQAKISQAAVVCEYCGSALTVL